METNRRRLRNRKKWADYEAAVEDMVTRTHHKKRPWICIEGNDKLFARIKVLKAVCQALNKQLQNIAAKAHRCSLWRISTPGYTNSWTRSKSRFSSTGLATRLANRHVAIRGRGCPGERNHDNWNALGFLFCTNPRVVSAPFMVGSTKSVTIISQT